MNIRNYVIILGVIVLLLLGIFGSKYLVSTEKEKNAEKILLSAIEKFWEHQNYTYEYTDVFDGYYVTTRIVYAAPVGFVSMKTPVFERAIYFNSSFRALCIKLFNKTSCSEVGENSSLLKRFDEMKKRVLLSQNVEKELKAMQIYIQSKAIEFDEKVLQGEVNGTPCNIIKYTLDYSKLAISDLQKLGMQPSDPAILYGSNYSFEYCIDNESIILSTKLDYVFLGEKKQTQTIVTEAKTKRVNKSELSFPELQNESKTFDLFINALNIEKNILACSNNQTTKDECIRKYASENFAPDVCLFAGSKKDVCILTIGTHLLRDDLCEKMENSSLKDDCWIEIAGKKDNQSYCGKIKDIGKKDFCVLLVNKTEECTEDADCIRVVRCDSRLCIPKKMENITTTCNSTRPELGCREVKSCGCVENKCAWKENETYRECVN